MGVGWTLHTAATTLVDAVNFGAQITDVTEGRLPDGAGAVIRLAVPTPGAPNQGPSNHAPTFTFLPAQSLFRGQTLQLIVSATDTDQPPQGVTYSLLVGPTGATLVGSNGQFAWSAPMEGEPMAELVIVRAQDDGVPPMASTQQLTIAVYPIPEFAHDATNQNEQALTVWTVAGHHYLIEYKTNLLDEGWLPLGSNFIGSGGWCEVTDEDETAQRFYRIQQWP